MAEQLTSSDIIRERLGLGVSPLAAPETRRAYAAAGLSPLGTQERERFARGGALSPMASESEKEAWKVAEVQAGLRDPMELPKSYGGLGERPEATTRRNLRMQQEWDKRYEMMVEQEKAARQFDLQQRAEARLQRDQDLRVEEAKTLEDREARVLDEAGLIINSIRGSVAPDGTVISRPIRPEDDDAIESLENLARLKFGLENKSAQAIWSTLYNDAMKFREEKMKQSQQKELEAIDLSVRTGKPIEEFGTYNERGVFQPKMEGMIAGAEQVKTEEEKQQEERVIRTEERRAEAQAGVSERKNKESQQREIQKNIRKATEDLRKMNASLAGRESLSETQRASLTAARDTLIDLQIEKAALDNLVFESPEAYGKAIAEGKKPPVGTTIYIGRTPVKVK